MADLWLIFGFALFVDGLVCVCVCVCICVCCVCVSLCVCVCVCVCARSGGGRFEWSFSKQTFIPFLSTVYHFCFEAGTILRAFNARLGKVDTFLMFIKMREFQQNAGGFNMLLLFLNFMKNFH